MCRVIFSEYYFKDHIGNKCTLGCFNVSSLVRLHACSLLVSCIFVILLNKFNSIQSWNWHHTTNLLHSCHISLETGITPLIYCIHVTSLLKLASHHRYIAFMSPLSWHWHHTTNLLHSCHLSLDTGITPLIYCIHVTSLLKLASHHRYIAFMSPLSWHRHHTTNILHSCHLSLSLLTLASHH